MTTVEYSELDDAYYAKCHDCEWEGRLHLTTRDADLDGARHDELHDDGHIR